MYNLKEEDIGNCILQIVITDKNIDIKLLKKNVTINIEMFELPLSDYFNKNVFLAKFTSFMDDINDNSAKSIRLRKSNKESLLPYIKRDENSFLIDFLPIHKNILKKHGQENFKFERYEDFERKLYYLLKDIMKIKIYS